MKRLSLFIGGATAAIVAYAALALVGGGVGVAHADFVCPVTPISTAAINNAKTGVFMTIGGGDQSNLTTVVPENGAPNNNSGSPPGVHGVPGDVDYTAIWDQEPPNISDDTKNPQD